MKFEKEILCIGAGYVGGPTMAVIASKCPSYRVTVVDINPERIQQWNSSSLPIFEPGLDEIVARVRGRNLFFSTDIAKGIRESEIIFVSVNTPTKAFGDGAGMAADLQYWEKTAQQIIENTDSARIIVEKSTVPVKTAEAMQRILATHPKGIQFEVVSNPEFLSEGTAVQNLLDPDRVLIGSMPTESGRMAAAAIAEIYAHWIGRDRILTTSLWSAELSKLVANAFLAQRISSINSLTPLCEKTAADVSEIARAIGSDKRIGSRFLSASVGFGGSCFKKDILNLVYIARSHDLPEVADYWEMVLRINEYQSLRFVSKIIKELFGTLVGKRIALFGFAFKANTGDTRESPAAFIARKLLEERAVVAITDPQALENAKKDLAAAPGEKIFEPDPYRAANGSRAIAVVTEWEHFSRLDYQRIYDTMEKPAFVFDGRNILDHRRLHEIGFNVFPLGKPPLIHV